MIIWCRIQYAMMTVWIALASHSLQGWVIPRLKDTEATLYIFSCCLLHRRVMLLFSPTRLGYSFHEDTPIRIDTVGQIIAAVVRFAVDRERYFRSRSFDLSME